jgi:hypothetical protein
MAKAFETWTVLKHGPLEKLSDNLWRVGGTMPNPNVRRAMTIARMKDGRLFIHNAIALEEALMAEIEAFGTPAFIVVPSGFHRQDAKIYKERYPSAAVYAPKAAIKKVEQVVKVDGDYASAPKDDTVRLVDLEGCKGEGILEVKSADGRTLVINDVLCNLPKQGGFSGYFLGPTGRLSVPRFSRWLIVKDKRAFAEHVGRLAGSDVVRIVPTHGAMIGERAPELLKQAVMGMS